MVRVAPAGGRGGARVIAAKLLRGNSDRKTRFHTERGARMPLREWFRLPFVLASRLRRGAEEPWFAPGTSGYLSSLTRPGWRVVECGAGSSTLWFARRAGSVLSLEHDVTWSRAVTARLEQEGLGNVDVRHVPLDEFVRVLRELPDATVDLAVVDSSEDAACDRVACVEAVARKVRPGGYLVLDDSDRPRYLAVERVLEHWPVRRFVGIKGRPLLAVETSVYTRPFDTAEQAPQTEGVGTST